MFRINGVQETVIPACSPVRCTTAVSGVRVSAAKWSWYAIGEMTVLRVILTVPVEGGTCRVLASTNPEKKVVFLSFHPDLLGAEGLHQLFEMGEGFLVIDIDPERPCSLRIEGDVSREEHGLF